MNDNPAFTQALQDLGMTRTESEVYLATLQTSVEDPVSGYKVAQVMGRDPANLSKTLAHLVKIGAVRLVQARPRHYVGVPVTEFTEILMARMEESKEKAISLMASLGSSATSQQPIPLENTSHILAQARRILSQSRGNVILCCDDKTLIQLEEFLEDLGKNFPDQATVLSDSPKEIPGIKMFAHQGPLPMNTGFSDNTTENWLLLAASTGQWLSAFYRADESSDYSHGWVGTNHEISLPVKSVIEALLMAKTTSTSKIKDTTAEKKPEETIEKIDDIVEAFLPGALASASHDAHDIESPNNTPEEKTDKENTVREESANSEKPVLDPLQEGNPNDEGFKFLVQHEEDEDEPDQ